NDRDVGVDRPHLIEHARRVADLNVDALQEVADVRANRACADDIDLHRASASPVLPKPPSARAVSSSDSTTLNEARDTGAMTICAIRSPRRIVNGSVPKFARITFTGPR